MRDEIIPSGGWKFDKEVANVFEDMLQRSIPGLNDLRSLTDKIITTTLPLGGSVLDVGCSDGQQIKRLIDLQTQSMQFKLFGIDNSEEMISKAVERCGNSVKFLIHDMTDGRPRFSNFPGKFDVILCVLTLQFIPIELRAEVMSNLRSMLRDHGRLIFVEKVIFPDSKSQKFMTGIYHGIKYDNGYSLAQIDAKNKSLRNVLVSKTIDENRAMLESAGFESVITFWQNTAFVGWVCS